MGGGHRPLFNLAPIEKWVQNSSCYNLLKKQYFSCPHLFYVIVEIYKTVHCSIAVTSGFPNIGTRIT